MLAACMLGDAAMLPAPKPAGPRGAAPQLGPAANPVAGPTGIGGDGVGLLLLLLQIAQQTAAQH
jgi:hypothetical protein